MIRNHKWKLIVSSLVVLLPMLFGLLVWNRLPQSMTTHWRADGSANGWSSRAFAVFALPGFMLLAHWFCIFCMVKDPKNVNQSGKVFGMVLWILPVSSLFANGMIYAFALGMKFNTNILVATSMGLLFVLIGNYLPKCRQNTTIGIKVKWALEDEENWNATHRVAGRVWVAGGLLMLVAAFLPEMIGVLAVIVLATLLGVIPTVYSWRFAQKQKNQTPKS